MTSQPTDSLYDFARNSQLMVPRGSRPPGPARALLGWLPQEHAESLLASQADGELSEALRTRVSQARDAVATRQAGTGQDGLISPLPGELADHATRLAATPAGARMRADGWEAAMVDLPGVAPSSPASSPTPPSSAPWPVPGFHAHAGTCRIASSSAAVIIHPQVASTVRRTDDRDSMCLMS